MKCLILFVISLGVAMSFPSPQEHDAEELENQMTGMSVSLLGVPKYHSDRNFESNTIFWFLGLIMLNTCEPECVVTSCSLTL